MDARFVSLVRTMLANNGKDLLFDAARFKSALPKEARGAFKKKRHVLSVAMERGAGQAIDAADDLPGVKQKLIGDLTDRFHIARPDATETIDLIAHVLRGDRAPAITEPPNPRARFSSSPAMGRLRGKPGRLILASIALVALIALLVLVHRLVQPGQPAGDPREIPTNGQAKSITAQFHFPDFLTPRHCEERSAVTIHTAVRSSETLSHRKGGLDCHGPAALAMTKLGAVRLLNQREACPCLVIARSEATRQSMRPYRLPCRAA